MIVNIYHVVYCFVRHIKYEAEWFGQRWNITSQSYHIIEWEICTWILVDGYYGYNQPRCTSIIILANN